MNNKIPSALDNLPDPSEAQPHRNPFGRRAEKPAAPDGDSDDEKDSGPSAAGGARAHRDSGKAAGKDKDSGEGSERNKRLADSSDILLSLPDDLKKRMESVIAYTYPHTGINQQSVFIRTAIAKLCKEHEVRYNEGERWPKVPKRKTA